MYSFQTAHISVNGPDKERLFATSLAILETVNDPFRNDWDYYPTMDVEFNVGQTSLWDTLVAPKTELLSHRVFDSHELDKPTVRFMGVLLILDYGIYLNHHAYLLKP